MVRCFNCRMELPDEKEDGLCDDCLSDFQGKISPEELTDMFGVEVVGPETDFYEYSDDEYEVIIQSEQETEVEVLMKHNVSPFRVTVNERDQGIIEEMAIRNEYQFKFISTDYEDWFIFNAWRAGREEFAV